MSISGWLALSLWFLPLLWKGIPLRLALNSFVCGGGSSTFTVFSHLLFCHHKILIWKITLSGRVRKDHTWRSLSQGLVRRWERKGVSDWQLDQCSICSSLDCRWVSAFIHQPIWLQIMGIDIKNEFTGYKWAMRFLSKVARISFRDRMRSSYTGERFWPDQWKGASLDGSSSCLGCPLETFQGGAPCLFQLGRTPRGISRTHWRDYNSACLGMPQYSTGRAGVTVRASPFSLLHL